MNEPVAQAVGVSHHPDLRDLPRTLLARMHVSKLAAGSVVFRGGDRLGFVHFVIDCEVRLVRHSPRA